MAANVTVMGYGAVGPGTVKVPAGRGDKDDYSAASATPTARRLLPITTPPIMNAKPRA